MSLIIIVALAAVVATLANNNSDSPVLWGLVTFICGIIGLSVFGFSGGLIGAVAGAAIYLVNHARFG